MNFLSILLIGLAMSTDAFAAAVAKGAAMRKPRFPDALRAGLIFGTIEAITPVVGWLLGRAAASYIAEWDHWIALGVLGALGLHMIHDGLSRDQEPAADAPPASFASLALTGFATSIDAMAIGVGIAFLDASIVTVALVIGLCTLVMVTSGVMLGRVLGALAGKRAEIAGGLLLIAIGVAIFFEHASVSLA